MCTKIPKKTIVSNKTKQPTSCRTWCRRNNSANVSSVLAPDAESIYFTDSDDEEPRRPLIFSKTKSPHHVHRRGCSKCYCGERPIPPVLQFERPLEDDRCMCPSASPPGFSPRCDNEVRSVLLKYSPQSRRKLAQENYTRMRRNYENATASYFVDLKKRLAELEEIMRREKSLEALQNIPEERSKEDILTLKEFRKRNYFECHPSGTDLNRPSVPDDHRCQHDFTLNERLKAVPKNPDVNGISRCKSCNRPSAVLMQDRDIQTSKSSISSATTKATDTENIKYTVGKEVYNIEVPKELSKETKSKDKKKKKKPPAPLNTYALRYQKGVY